MSIEDQLEARARHLRETTSETMTASLLEKAAAEIKRLREYEWMYKDLCK